MPEPFYIQHSDLPRVKNNYNYAALDLCEVCEQHVPGQILGAQCHNSVWSVITRSDRARSYMVNTMKGVNINNTKVEIHDKYPTGKTVPNEKIVFRDVPFDLKDEDILQFLNNKGIMIKTGVIAGRLRDKNSKLTQYLSGDRIVYVKGNFSPVLHSFANINNNKCKILHQSQHLACQRCRCLGHHTSETNKCDAYIEDTEGITIKSPQYVLCNYYPSPLKVFKTKFASSEHTYQWRFLKHIGEDALAQEVIEASCPADAKAVSTRVPRHLHKNWHSIKMCVMKDILHATADYCAKFKDELLSSGGKNLVEAVMGDIFWSSGLPPRVAESTKPEYYPGANQLGHVLESVRSDLMKEAIMCKDIHEIDFPSQESLSTNTISDTTSFELSNTDLPHSTPITSSSSSHGTPVALSVVSPHPSITPQSSSLPPIQPSTSNSVDNDLSTDDLIDTLTTSLTNNVIP